jgi:hypothetical protein
MMAVSDNMIKAIANEIATDLIKQRGQNISDTVAGFAVADLLDNLDSDDVRNISDSVVAYIKAAHVSVSIPFYQFNVDGTKADPPNRDLLEF